MNLLELQAHSQVLLEVSIVEYVPFFIVVGGEELGLLEFW